MSFNLEIDLKIYISLNLVIINTGGYVYSRGSVNYLIHIFQRLHLFQGLRVFRTLESASAECPVEVESKVTR